MNLSQIASWILMLSIFGLLLFVAYQSMQPTAVNNSLGTMQTNILSAIATIDESCWNADVNHSLSIVQANIVNAIATSSYWANCVPVDMNYVSVGQNQVAHEYEMYCPLTNFEIEKLKEAGK